MGIQDRYQSAEDSVIAFGVEAEDITPNDSADLAKRYKYILCGGAAGSVEVHDINGNAVTLYVNAGDVLRFRPRRILATGTTATGLVGVVR